MGDRRPFSFRFWQNGPPAARRTPAAQTTPPRPATSTTAAPPATTTSAATTPPRSTAETETSGRPTATTITPTSLTPLTAEPETSTTRSNTPANIPATPISTTQPKTETQMAEQPPTNAPTTTTPPPNDLQMAGLSNITSARPTNGHQTESPSRATTKSPSPSPSRAITQSPPKPSSPSRVAPQAKSPSPSPSRSTTQSQSPPQPSSPSRVAPQAKSSSPTPSRSTTQSRSPPLPSSPSRAAPQARSAPSSPSRTGSQSPSTPQRASQLRSSSRLATISPKQTSSPSTKGVQSTSTSKESTQGISNSNEAPTFASNEKEQKPETSQQEPLQPQLKADGQTVDEKSIKENQMEVMSPKLSEIIATTSPVQDPKTPALVQKVVSSTINVEHNPLNEPNKKPEETKEVKEVEQATSTEAKEQIKKESTHPLTPKSSSEAQTTQMAEIARKPDQIQMMKKEALNTKEILPASFRDIKPPNATTPKPRNSSMSSDTREQSALPRGDHVRLSKDIRDDISTLINLTNIGDRKGINDKPLSVITLAGENRGASMQMGSNSSKREGQVHIHRGYKTKRDGSEEVTVDGVESSNKNKSEEAKITEDQQKESYINNNVQGINNSIVFNSSISERNPGVHMVITRVSNEPIESTDRRSHETWKAEFNTTPGDKLTYEPTARSRCVRDLFREPSDSDPEMP